MRIVGGRLAGKNLVSPGSRIRPTSEEVRGRWLDRIEPEIQGARMLELFAGSGAVGLEALSRGAQSVDFVENAGAALHALKANIARCRAKNLTRVFKRDAIPFAENIDKVAYDIVIADPPYGSRKLERIVHQWHTRPFSRILSVEHATDQRLEWPGQVIRLGDTSITTFALTAG